MSDHARISIAQLAEEIAQGYRLAREIEAADRDAATAARDRADALAAALLRLDPNSPGEALSLLCVLDTELDCFIANHCNDDAQIQIAPLQKALRSVGRGLVEAGTRSPLLGTYTRAELFDLH
jgi:hypothetical protein